MLVHRLKIPTHLKAQAFEDFARTRWLPAMHMSATRVGLLSKAVLLRDGTDFLLLCDWDGLGTDLPRLDDTTVDRSMAAFDVEVTLVGSFAEVAQRSGEGS